MLMQFLTDWMMRKSFSRCLFVLFAYSNVWRKNINKLLTKNISLPQLLDNLPVCQDFGRNMCTRVNCKFVHLLDREYHNTLSIKFIQICDYFSQQRSLKFTSNVLPFAETTRMEFVVGSSANIITSRFSFPQRWKWLTETEFNNSKH